MRIGEDYRFARIEGLVDVVKYSVEGVFVDQGLELGQGSSKRVINMDFASNSPVTRVNSSGFHLISRMNLIVIPAKSSKMAVFLLRRNISIRKLKTFKSCKITNSQTYYSFAG